MSPLGPILALTTAVLWAGSSVVMAAVARRVGAWTANLLRILLSSVVLLVGVLPAYLGVRWWVTGTWPNVPSGAQVVWAVLSGWAGLVVGDIFYYEGLVRLGPRRAVKMNTLAPVAALGAGSVWLGEALTWRAVVGVIMVLGAVGYAALNRPGRRQEAEEGERPPSPEPERPPVGAWVCGVISAGAIGLGSVLGRVAFQTEREVRPLDPIVATVIRVVSAGVVLWTVPLITRSGGRVLGVLRDRTVRRRVGLGTFCGPLVGMICYVGALRLAPAGVVSTLVATSTIVVIPIVAVRYRVRVGWDLVVAAGVGMMTW